MNWTASTSSDVQKYYIYYSTSSGVPYSYEGVVFPPSTTYTDHGLSVTNTYYYVVTAIDASGNESADSTEVWGTPLATGSDPAPAAPANLTAIATATWIDLEWDDNTEYELSHYKVYKSTTRGSWTVLNASVSASSLYDTSAVENGTTYWYVVTAVDTESRESDYSNDAHATPNPDVSTAPGKPTGLGANPGDAEIALAWTASTAADMSSYNVYRSTVSGKYYSYVAGVEAPVTVYLDSPVSNGETYYYVTTSIDENGNESGDSNEASATPIGTYGSGTGTGPSPAPSPAPTGGGGGGCFIATACYGSPLAGEVRILLRFRDRCLLTNSLGRTFVGIYNRVSPPAAEFIRKRPVLRFLVRMQLKPWVKIIKAITN